MPTKKIKQDRRGFSLVELLIYISIFVVSSIFLVAILTSVTKVQVRQKSTNTVNEQITFVTQTIQRIVQGSSLIDMEAGISSPSLLLRMSQGELDPTIVSVKDNRLFIQQGAGGLETALTDTNVRVDNFEITKFENPGGGAIVHANIALSYDTDNPKEKFSRVIETAITRISAASFDSDLIPIGVRSIGNSSNKWKDGYFSGAVGIGTNAPSDGPKLRVTGDIDLPNAGDGIILQSPLGACYKLTVSEEGAIVTTLCGG
ncbi:hypothetical protein CL629_03490 [bacterium]|nr:hypothetical protein [bacterium]|tara:strand:- start:2052 stop:2828 length:777 start_codon:yes stop_codon:yes gene_type:complete